MARNIVICDTCIWMVVRELRCSAKSVEGLWSVYLGCWCCRNHVSSQRLPSRWRIRRLLLSGYLVARGYCSSSQRWSLTDTVAFSFAAATWLLADGCRALRSGYLRSIWWGAQQNSLGHISFGRASSSVGGEQLANGSMCGTNNWPCELCWADSLERR
jgi:hypothetical protein